MLIIHGVSGVTLKWTFCYYSSWSLFGLFVCLFVCFCFLFFFKSLDHLYTFLPESGPFYEKKKSSNHKLWYTMCWHIFITSLCSLWSAKPIFLNSPFSIVLRQLVTSYRHFLGAVHKYQQHKNPPKLYYFSKQEWVHKT